MFKALSFAQSISLFCHPALDEKEMKEVVEMAAKHIPSLESLFIEGHRVYGTKTLLMYVSNYVLILQ